MCSNMSCILLFWFTLQTSEKLILVLVKEIWSDGEVISDGFSLCFFWGISISFFFFLCSTVYVFYRVPLKCTVDLCSVAPQRCQFTGQESGGVKAWATTMEDTIDVQIHSFNVVLTSDKSRSTKSSLRISYCPYLQIPQGACKTLKKSMFWYTSLPRTIILYI